MSTSADTASLRVPVLLVIFNRPDTTRQVFEAVRRARPSRLYVAADGPRPGVPTDITDCAEARSIVAQVDWQCEVKTLFRQVNLNCGVGPSSAFSWFFDQEEEGIILEDDCVPSQSFFWYCQELLERYRNDHRVMHIGGNNFLNGWQKDGDYSYYFSRSGHVWGWATWRRAWQHFDFKIGLYPKLRGRKSFRSSFLHWPERFYRFRKFDAIIDKGSTTDGWDYQWDFARYINSGLAIVPQVNLVKNVGFGNIGTHTKNVSANVSQMQAHDIDLPLRHPPYVIRDMESDKRYFRNLVRDIIFSKLGI